jgi:hypothetical protein
MDGSIYFYFLFLKIKIVSMTRQHSRQHPSERWVLLGRRLFLWPGSHRLMQRVGLHIHLLILTSSPRISVRQPSYCAFQHDKKFAYGHRTAAPGAAISGNNGWYHATFEIFNGDSVYYIAEP